MDDGSVWIKDLLEAAEKDPTPEAVRLIESCGAACAVRKGHVPNMAKLRDAASWCGTRSDYVRFLKDAISDAVREEEDGIVIPLGKQGCTCPLAGEVRSPMLCCCTQGSNKATWSEFFGRDVRVEMVETFMRGGSDCVIKVFV